jgi:hypothetical protein
MTTCVESPAAAMASPASIAPVKSSASERLRAQRRAFASLRRHRSRAQRASRADLSPQASSRDNGHAPFALVRVCSVAAQRSAARRCGRIAEGAETVCETPDVGHIRGAARHAARVAAGRRVRATAGQRVAHQKQPRSQRGRFCAGASGGPAAMMLSRPRYGCCGMANVRRGAGSNTECSAALQ